MDFDEAQFAGKLVLGVDEVGRGCLAGPVVAAVVRRAKKYSNDLVKELGVNDSKKLSERKRDELSALITADCETQIAEASVAEVDRYNILQATFLAMTRALLAWILKYENSDVKAEIVLLVDGNQKIPFEPKLLSYCIGELRLTAELSEKLFRRIHSIAQVTIVGGDGASPSIAMASIVAKVYRDTMMKKLDETYPGYGFAQHKGYGSLMHRQAIQLQGPSEIHRRSFAGVKEYVSSKEPVELSPP